MPSIETIPPDAWPLIDLLFNITCAVAGIWLAISVFVAWRRHASNLTPVHDAPANHKATPDFLSVDETARREAMRRADDFERDLDKRDRDEARERTRRGRSNGTLMQAIARMVSFGMALFSLATMISGTVFQVTIMGRYWEQYSAGERLMAVVRDHPIGVTVTVIVILYNVVRFFMSRPWQQEA